MNNARLMQTIVLSLSFLTVTAMSSCNTKSHEQAASTVSTASTGHAVTSATENSSVSSDTAASTPSFDIASITTSPAVTSKMTSSTASQSTSKTETGSSIPTSSTEKTESAVESKMVQIPVHFNTGKWDAGYYDNSQNSLEQYVSTQRFTTETLPVGSIVKLKKGWQCNVSLWTTDQSQSKSVNPFKSVYEIQITEEWWENYTACGFNLGSKTGDSKLTDWVQALQVYIPKTTKQFDYTWNDDGALKILAVGNSFSEDMMRHVYNIAESLGVQKIKLGNLYYGGCRLQQHYNFWKNNSKVYQYQTNTDGKWSTQSAASFEAAFETKDWDHICFQESAQEIQTKEQLYRNLPKLIEMAKKRCPNAKIVWHMPWANLHANYNNDIETMYRDLCVASRKFAETTNEFELIIPSGTTIQNMRANGFGGNLLRDGWHLSEGIGRYAAGLTLVKQLTGLDINQVSWRLAGISQEDAAKAIKAANDAINSPYFVTEP